MATWLASFVILALALQATDTDKDGLSDFHEIHKYRTDPRNADTDNDGIPDGDWHERREFTYVVRCVVQVMKPVTPEFLDGDFQDVRVLAEHDDRFELEVLLYPFSTANTAPAEKTKVRKADLQRWLEPGFTADWDDALRKDMRRELAADGIDVDALDESSRARDVAAWLMRRAEFSDRFASFVTAFDASGKPYVPDELAPHVNGGVPTTTEDFAREVSARGMFEHRTRGSCSPSAIYLSGCLRAIGIPTRTILVIPLFDAGDERQWELARQALHQLTVRRAVLTGMQGLEQSWASHTFLEVFVDGRWRRLDYAELDVGILRPERFGLAIHVGTWHDWADARMPETIGRRQTLNLRDAVFRGANPYALLSISEHMGEHAEPDAFLPGRLTASVTALQWTDDPSLDEVLRGALEPRGRFGLLARIEGPKTEAELRELLATCDRTVRIESPGRSHSETALDLGCVWFRRWPGETRPYAIVYVPLVGDRAASGTTYRLELPNESNAARIELEDGAIEIVRP